MEARVVARRRNLFFAFGIVVVAAALRPRREADDVDSGGGESSDARLSKRPVSAERVRAELERAEEGSEGTGGRESGIIIPSGDGVVDRKR